MLNLLTITSLLITAGSQAAVPHTSANVIPGPVQCRIASDLAHYEVGDVPLLYLTFENSGDELIEVYYPRPELPETIPADLFDVRHAGERLAFARTPRYHPVARVKTFVQPGETYTLAVPLEHVARLRPDSSGSYEVDVTDYYSAHIPATTARFTLALGSQVPGQDPLLEELSGSTWRDLDTGPAGTRSALVHLAGDAAREPGLRARALTMLGDSSAAQEIDLRDGAMSEVNVIVALAAVQTVDGATLPRTTSALLRAVGHRDLAVRRAAASKLAQANLDRGQRQELAGRFAANRDPWLGSLIARVLEE